MIILLINILFPIFIMPSQDLHKTDIWHEFHLSKSIVKYSDEDKTFQVSLHLYIDDLEDALKSVSSESMYLCTKKEAETANQVILKYLETRFAILKDNKAIKLNFVGKEISESLDGVWIYLESDELVAPKELMIQNQLLTEVFTDQRNIMSVKINGQEKHLMLSIDDFAKNLTWK